MLHKSQANNTRTGLLLPGQAEKFAAGLDREPVPRIGAGYLHLFANWKETHQSNGLLFRARKKIDILVSATFVGGVGGGGENREIVYEKTVENKEEYKRQRKNRTENKCKIGQC
jgi:hypothetical protein